MAAVAVAAAGCLAVAACGTISASSLSLAPVFSRTPDPLASLSPSKVATRALANLNAAPSLTVAGTFNDSGKTIALNFGIKPGHGCTGTLVTSGEGSVKLIMIGRTIYFRADAKYWRSQLSDASAVIALLNGRYIETSTRARGMSSMASLCDVSKLMRSEELTGKFTKGKITTVRGTRVLPLVFPKRGVLYVTDTSKPEISQLVETKNIGNGVGKFTFAVGIPVTLTPPPAAQVLNGSAVGL